MSHQSLKTTFEDAKQLSSAKGWFKMKKTQVTGELTYKKLVFLWAMVLFGYFLFVVQWYSIGNFAGLAGGGWGAAFFQPGTVQSPFIRGVPNWMITLGRGLGSFFAGWLIVKFGHKYAVIAVLALCVASFPFIILGQNQVWNSASIAGGAKVTSDGVAAGGFAGFVIFRVLLGIGGTTLITYTNSIIGKMPQSKRPFHINTNTFGFNAGAFIANIFFVIPIINDATLNSKLWTGVLSGFVVLMGIVLLLYLIFGQETVAREIKNKQENLADAPNAVTFKAVVKQKDTWKIAFLFILWLIAVVFINSSTMRQFIEQSPANFRALAIDHALTTNKRVVSGVTSRYYWVWPLFICFFVAGFFGGSWLIPVFSKTRFHRTRYLVFLFGVSAVLSAAAIMSGYFGGYDNQIALAFMFVLIFLSGVFIWGAQSVCLSVPQQVMQTSAKYVGIAAGIIWGVGYFGYTAAELSLSLISSYVHAFNFASAVEQVGLTIRQGGAADYNSALALFNSGNHSGYKTSESVGNIIMIVAFSLILLGLILAAFILPKPGYRDQNGTFIEFNKKWNPLKLSHWNFRHPDNIIPKMGGK